MTWSKSTTRVSDAQALWTYQLTGKANIDALTSLFATESQSWEEIAEDIQQARAIDTAVGDQLDQLGALVGQPRNGLTDERYRVWLKARIYVNRSSGVPSEIYGAAYIILGQDADLFLRQIPVGHALVSRTKSTVVPGDLYTLLQSASAVTVPFQYWYPTWETTTGTNVFTFASGSTVVTGTTLGFDNARFLEMASAEGYSEDIDYIGTNYSTDLAESLDFTAVSGTDPFVLQGSVFEFSDPTGTTLTANDLRDRHTSVSGLDSNVTSVVAPAFVSTMNGGAFTMSGVLRFLDSYSIGIFRVSSGFSDIIILSRRSFSQLALLVGDSSGSTTLFGPTLTFGSWEPFVITYSTSGTATFYLSDGSITTDTGTTRSPDFSATPSLDAEINDADTEFSGILNIWGRTFSEDEAVDVVQYLTRKYTDKYK